MERRLRPILTTTIEISKLMAFDYLGMLRAWATLSLVLTNGLRDLKPPRALKALRSNGQRSLTIWNCDMPSNPRARRSLQKWSISKHLRGRGDGPYPSPALCWRCPALEPPAANSWPKL